MELKTQCFTHRSLRSNLDFSGTILEQNQDTNEKGGLACLLNQKWQNAFFYPKINILCQFCLQKIYDRFVTYPKPSGGLSIYNQYSASPKMGWVAKNDAKMLSPRLPLGASASLTWNEDACALWAASHLPFERGKGKSQLVQSYWGNLPNIVMLIRRGAFYKYNKMHVYIIYMYVYISYKEIGCVCGCVWVCMCT